MLWEKTVEKQHTWLSNQTFLPRHVLFHTGPYYTATHTGYLYGTITWPWPDPWTLTIALILTRTLTLTLHYSGVCRVHATINGDSATFIHHSLLFQNVCSAIQPTANKFGVCLKSASHLVLILYVYDVREPISCCYATH